MDKPVLEERALKLSRLLRSRSTSNMLDIVDDSSLATRDNAPSSSHISSKYHTSVPRPSEGSRWSFRSLRKEWRSRTHAYSLSHLPDGGEADKIAGFEHCNQATFPNRQCHLSRFRSRSSSGALLVQASGPQEWPERISSRKGWGHSLRTSVSSRTLSKVNHSDNTPPDTQIMAGKGGSRPSSSTRVRVGECYGPQLIADKSRATAQKVPTQSRSSEILRRPVVTRGTSKNSLSLTIETHEHKHGQSSLCHLGNSPPSHQCPKVDRDVLTQQILPPSRDPLTPESPGFPKMLAAMSFPAPPSVSRPPSSDKSTNSTILGQANTTEPPTIRPRTSSKRACISNSIPTASLDEVLMQPAWPIIKPPKLDDALQPHSKSEKCLTLTPMASPVAVAVGTENVSLALGDLKSQPSSGASSTPLGTGYNSITSATSGNTDSQRQSLLSDITAMTSSYQGSPTTDTQWDFFTGSTLTDSNTCSTDAHEANEGFDPRGESNHRHIVSSPIPIEFCHREDQKLADLELRRYSQSLSGKVIADDTIASFASCDVDGRKSIVERRIARRAKVQAYKRRDLDAAKFALRGASIGATALESKDSPILGWFTDNVTRPRNLSLREPSQARIINLMPTRNRSCHELFSLSREDSALLKPGQITSESTAKMVKTTSATSAPTQACTLSSIMTTEITPQEHDCASVLASATHEIAISPIMVVADLKPQPDTSALSISPAYSPIITYSPSRPTFKHRLKIKPQPRQRPMSIMIHRNPVTGDIERTTSSPNKSNRHSFTSMPSLPPSPNTLSLRRRSHPTGIVSLVQPSGVWNPTDLEQLVWDSADQEERNENKSRAVSRKERLQREKLAKEEEISELVEKTINAAKPGQSDGGGINNSEGEHIAHQIEGRIQRLEENGDAWLRVVKTLLGNMSKTLEDLREEDNSGGLTMSEFTINMDAEARRMSFYNTPAPMMASFTSAAGRKRL
ncbi:hypothetical protein F4804DRAFT_325734 [Jackrogersella minutella]|nr:hypothetical protein F4804DRAFT_325734 [Jackrogersella minutella]